MSMMLGPVHHWMYKKIKTTEARERYIVQAFQKRFGESVDGAISKVYKIYPPSTDDQPLEEVMVNVSIHQGIQDLVIKAETREAAVIAALCERCGDEANELAVKAAYDHGVVSGEMAIKEKGVVVCDTSRAFEYLGDFLCDGMPCDRGAQIQSESEHCTTWDHTSCVHEKYWKEAGASFETMCDLLTSWIAGFGRGANPKISYKRNKAIATGDRECLSTYRISG